tara:strand:- start:1049 stop:1651 length:603 start_codon:yes stop_codon:yes gene_type:complete
MPTTYKEATEQNKIPEFIEQINREATAVISKSQQEDPARSERDKIVETITQALRKQVWTPTQVKDIESLKAKIAAVKIRAKAFLNPDTTKLITKGRAIPIESRPLSLFQLTELAEAARQPTTRKRKKTRDKTPKLSPQKETEIRDKMLELDSFTLKDFNDQAELGYNPSASQIRKQLNPLVESKQITKDASQRPPKYSKA